MLHIEAIAEQGRRELRDDFLKLLLGGSREASIIDIKVAANEGSSLHADSRVAGSNVQTLAEQVPSTPITIRGVQNSPYVDTLSRIIWVPEPAETATVVGGVPSPNRSISFFEVGQKSIMPNRKTIENIQ